jgi:hypothetical protein
MSTNQPDPVDRQAVAYRDAQPSDWATDAILAGAVVHEPGTGPERTPAEWDTAGWDTGRMEPKTVTEAQALLAARIADPEAPDDHTVAGAYDQLGEA